MDRFAETAAILISIASNTVAIMGCSGGKCINYINFPLEHPIISSETQKSKWPPYLQNGLCWKHTLPLSNKCVPYGYVSQFFFKSNHCS